MRFVLANNLTWFIRIDGCLFRIVKFTGDLWTLGAESFNLLENLVWILLPTRSRCVEHTGVNDTTMFCIIYYFKHKQFTRFRSHRKQANFRTVHPSPHSSHSKQTAMVVLNMSPWFAYAKLEHCPRSCLAARNFLPLIISLLAQLCEHGTHLISL